MRKKNQKLTIFLKKNRKGLSTVVISLIIILISLVAVGIIWVVVRNVIQTGTKEVTLGQFTLDAKIKDVNVYNLSNNVSLTVKRNPGVGEFSKMNFVFYDGKNSEVVTQPVSLNELEEKWFMFHLSTLNVSELISISIFPYVKQDEKEILGNILDKYNLGGNKVNLPEVSTNCVTSSTIWKNNPITLQDGWFIAVFDVTPYNDSKDGVFGLSQGAQTAYSGFSTLLRFNQTGHIEAYDLNVLVYRSLQLVPYTANTKYSFRFIVNLTSQNYSVYVTPQGGSQVLLASDFKFRTPATLINNCGLIGSSLTFDVCDFNIISSIPGSCVPATCASLGKTCGTGYLNGSCSGTLSCGIYGNGSCQTGYSCVGGNCVVNITYTETFYVCQGGDGSNPKVKNCATAWNLSSLNISTNWNTAVATVDGKIGPGDRIFFMHDGGDILSAGIGLGNESVLTIRQSGTAAAHITLEGDGTAVISGNHERPGVDGGGRDYIDVRNLTIKDTQSSLAYAGGNCISIYDGEHWTIEGCNLGPSGGALGNVVLSGCGKDWIVRNNYIHDSPNSHNVYVYSCTGPYGSSDMLFEYNHFANSGSNNLQFNGVDVYFTNITVRNNLFENPGWADIELASTDGAEIYGNIFVHNTTSKWEGILLGDDTTTHLAHVKNTKIWNNVFYGYFESMIYMTNYHNVGTPCIAELYNNIFYSLGGACSGGPTCTDQYYINYAVSEAAIAASDYNLFYTSANTKFRLANSSKLNFTTWKVVNSGFDTHSLETNPLLINAGGGNYHLQASSPCINVGKNVGLTKDYDGVAIPQGGICDIGPYEYV